MKKNILLLLMILFLITACGSIKQTTCTNSGTDTLGNKMHAKYLIYYDNQSVIKVKENIEITSSDSSILNGYYKKLNSNYKQLKGKYKYEWR